MSRSVKKSKVRQFNDDFAPLERALEMGVVCPVERMIVELGLTPHRVKKLEVRYPDTVARWFFPAYKVMVRHRMLGRGLSWEGWLAEYRRRRRNHASMRGK